jgi:hypothetical protein
MLRSLADDASRQAARYATGSTQQRFWTALEDLYRYRAPK